MCGIVGLSFSEQTDFHSEPVSKKIWSAVRKQNHRGPDAQDIWLHPEKKIALGHNRLSLLDLTTAGSQPMHSSCGKFSIVFNGEIYNWQELRQELSKDTLFKTKTDTEVILEAYKKYGEDCVKKLRGMFAFAIYDHIKDLLFCARDRVGKKPFFYICSEQGFYFASEIPALRLIEPSGWEVNEASLVSFFLHNLRHIPEPHTIFREVHHLDSGHAMIVQNGRIQKMWRYFELEHSDRTPSAADLRTTLEEAVQLRMIADVPVGALLSGGVDSTAIVKLMRKFSKDTIYTFALGKDKFDEDLARARQVAAEIKSDHHEFYFEPHSAYKDFKNMMAVYGEPIFLVPLLHALTLFQNLKSFGIKAAMVGHGADEIFAGYSGLRNIGIFSELLTRAPWLLASLLPLFNPHQKESIKACLESAPGKRKAQFYRRVAFRSLNDFVHAEKLKSLPNLVADEMEKWGAAEVFDSYLDENLWLSLMIENRHSVQISSDLPAMMASVETRAPFLDQKIVSLAFQINTLQKIGSFFHKRKLKYILKQAVTDLVPPNLLYAKKRGFGYEIKESQLIVGDWRKYAEDVFDNVDDCNGLFDPSATRELWQQYALNRSGSPEKICKLFAAQYWLQNIYQDLKNPVVVA